MPQTPLFAVEATPTAVVIAPLRDIGDGEMPLLELELRQLTDILDRSPRKGWIVDFRHSPHFGSTLLSALLRLWHRVRARSGRMIFCNLSDDEIQMLEVTRLDAIWPTRPSLTEAMAALESTEWNGADSPGANRRS